MNYSRALRNAKMDLESQHLAHIIVGLFFYTLAISGLLGGGGVSSFWGVGYC